MKKMEKIVKIVNARVGRKLTQKELEKYEDEYLQEAKRLMDKVTNFDPLVLDKILSPFEYWLRNKLECEAFNQRAVTKS